LASDIVTSIVAARDGSLWFATPEAVSRLRNGQVRNYTTADGLSTNHALNLYEDRDGGIWAGTVRGIAHLTGDRFAVGPSLPNNIGVFPIGEDRSGSLYMTVATKGIFRLENHRAINAAPEIGATHVVETREGDAWISGFGIDRFQPAGLQGLRGHDEPLDYAAFGRGDGLDATECSFGFPNSALTPDGKLWVATPQGLAMLDLPHLPWTNRKPAIYMEEVTVGRNVQPPGHELVLPPGTHHVELHFDAIEISSPEKIRMQYRLDSVDSEWLDAGHPAHAIYSNMPAGTHAFHVRASNRDGIWDRVGAVYSIVRQPYFYETALFQLAAATAGCLFLFGLYRLRLRGATARLGERMAERERIARELHDTLLQGFQGLVLHFQAVLDQIPNGEPAHQTMKTALSQADQVIIEGRRRVRDLRAEGTEANEISQELAGYGEELAKDSVIAFKVTLVGSPELFHPVVREEIYRIAREALANAFRHSQASSIEVEVAYDRATFWLRVRDNGSGIDREILDNGRNGHWGLSGMRERAQNIAAQLSIWSNPGAGTEIDLKVPAKIAYARGSKRSPWQWLKHWIKRGASGVR
jgi:signal transduction histidine kinase